MMAVVRWDPWGDLAALQREMNQLFNRSYEGPAGNQRAFVPLMDAFRTDEGLVVRLELPGMSPDDVDIAVQDGVLAVRGERPMSGDVAEENWLRRERPTGAFERSFALPEGTDPEGISASFDLGVLELRIPHPPEQKPRRITINAGERNGQPVEVGEGSSN